MLQCDLDKQVESMTYVIGCINDIKPDDTQLFFPLFSSLFLYCEDFCSVFARADLLTVTALYILCLAQLTIGSDYNKYRCLWKLWVCVIYVKFCQQLNYPPKSNFRVRVYVIT